MIYKILNYFLEKKVRKLRLIVKIILNDNLWKQKEIREKIINKDDIVSMVHQGIKNVDENITTILKRLDVENKYALLCNHFENDSKRKFMINMNFYKFLRSIKYLYSTSNIAVSGGILNASAEIYHTINEAEDSFDELMKTYKLPR